MNNASLVEMKSGFMRNCAREFLEQEASYFCFFLVSRATKTNPAATKATTIAATIAVILAFRLSILSAVSICLMSERARLIPSDCLWDSARRRSYSPVSDIWFGVAGSLCWERAG